MAAVGWVNSPDVEKFTVTFTDGHVVTVDAQENPFFVIQYRQVRPAHVPAIREIVVHT